MNYVNKRFIMRQWRVRKKIARVNTLNFKAVVFKSNKNLYVSLFDIKNNKVVGAVSSLSFKKDGNVLANNLTSAKLIGERFGALCQNVGVDRICFDRGANLYHGKIAALADGIRSAGIQF